MILEEETFETYGYYPSDLKPQSHKLILATCDGCGKVRTFRRGDYHALCQLCANTGRKCSDKTKAKIRAAHKGEIFTEERKANISAAKKGKILSEEHKAEISATLKGRKSPMFGKHHTEEAKAKISAAITGENNPNYNGGKKLVQARSSANRRKLGYSLIMPLKKGEEGHHVTNVHVIGVPAKVHQSMGGNSRRKHRTRVLQWLKANDKKKYVKVLCVLANTSNPSGL